MEPIPKKSRLIFLFFSFIIFTACGIWQDFTTYFNLYYNTTDLYDKAEEQILEQKTDLFSTEPPTVPGSVNTDLVKVIEKCSNILQFSAQTSYVDDALLIIGKCFYYQRNYQKSQRKFEELLSTQPESEYVLEAELWIGKCQMRLKDYADGLASLGEVRAKAIEEDEEEIVEETYIEEIVYRKTVLDYTGAISSANEFLLISSNDEIKAEVWYEVGNLNLIIGDTESAITAFQNVFDYSPPYELEVSTNLHLGRALREVGRSEAALTIFEDMRSEDKYEEEYSDIELEIGITESVLQNYTQAIDQLTKVDTTYKNTPNSGAARFEIAKIYETGLVQLDSAAVYYKKAVASSLPKDYILTAKDKDRVFSRYTSIRNDLSIYNKQKFYLHNPEQFVQDSIAYVQDSLAIAEEIAEAKELQEIWSGLDSLLNQSDTTGFYQDSLKVADTLVVKDTTGFTTRDSVFAKIREPERFDSLMAAHFDSMFVNKTFDLEKKRLLEEQKRQNELLASQLTSELPDTLKFKNNPPKRPLISEDSLNTNIAKNQLELGNLFLSELNIPDSAYWYYENTLSNYPNTQYYPTTIYAMGSYYLTVDQKARADSLFNIIYENYRNESIVNAAADKLNKPFIDLNYDPALERYSQAETLMLAGNFTEAVDNLYSIFKEFPQSDIAPKALYTCGWIYENDIKDPERASQYYDTLIVNYPATEYVKITAPKITLYKQELRKRELALQDSLNALIVSDSLGTDSLIVEDDFINPEDTIQVAYEDDEQKPVTEEKKEIEKTIIPISKEPVWNPRRRR
ncbi:MAG: tetratricopeptide repeat protein [Ignavibacteria bacterium]|nr:tetratricopeptide repeat protein [Ignavibacteria bacterium]MBT8382498.1 tetratricopeptide repeat protein [Ignavibacteria bacterium]MBT8391795.1 tetratricopeptide repeat protein [Ignavibacteria bacterium]NNJ51856.1 tetratricopeptide repeat protein [Ignavibacteriaceae bacterium]NNL21935.1 tetratricopeptide repeat protein [Ignavibacteriaceae bacterium]